SIGTAIRLLEEKAERAGKTVVKIDRWYPSSKTCSHCGHIVEKLPLSIRDWACAQCGTRHDRDANAAQNILAVGHTVSAHGGTVRRPRAKAPGRTSPRSANRQGAAHA
ncbi:MAG: RNA-guided endonuclease InsQ/TnpB family protein, partial [Metallibacterium sp.]